MQPVTNSMRQVSDSTSHANMTSSYYDSFSMHHQTNSRPTCSLQHLLTMLTPHNLDIKILLNSNIKTKSIIFVITWPAQCFDIAS